MIKERFLSLVKGLTIGKRLPEAIYIHEDSIFEASRELSEYTLGLRIEHRVSCTHNIIKLHTKQWKVSFLDYPDFFQDPHPRLNNCILMNFEADTVKQFGYRTRTNPPILHRKELFLHENHPYRHRFSKLTKQEEDHGLYKDCKRIGLLEQWQGLLQKHRLTYREHCLVQL